MAGSSRPSTFSYALIEAMNEGHCGLPTEEQDGGTHVGTVDKVEGGHLKILRPDQRPRNQHQYVAPNWMVAVDDRVRLNLILDEAKRLWAMIRPASQFSGRRRESA